MARIKTTTTLFFILSGIFILGVAGCEPIPLKEDIVFLADPPEWKFKEKLVSDSPVDWGSYGSAMDMDENRMVINDDQNGSGKVLIYKRSGNSWVLEDTLSGSPGSGFGYSVGISGDYAIVGAPYIDKAYIYQFNGSDWHTITRIALVTAASAWGYGYAVDICGDFAIVGAPLYDQITPAYTDCGWAVIYYKDQGGAGSWGEVEQIEPTNKADNLHFGNSVSITSGYAIVGAPGKDSYTGAAYIFNKVSATEWGASSLENFELLAANGQVSDNFGWSVSISGRYAIVGTKADAAYIFNYSAGAWQRKRIMPSTVSAGDYFGISVAIYGGYAVVGAKGDTVAGLKTGAAYVLERFGSGWEQISYLSRSGLLADDEFGYSVAVSNGFCAVGARLTDEGGNQRGSVYTYYRD